VFYYSVNYKYEGRLFLRKGEDTNNLNGTSLHWGTNNFSGTQYISPLLQNLRVYYRAQKCLRMVPIPSQMNPVHTPFLYDSF
jgi:hypothetical protein